MTFPRRDPAADARPCGTILVVGDDPLLRGILRANFELVGYRVTDVNDADAALGGLDRARPDAILVDVLAAGNDRAAFVRRIRRHPQGGHLPLIVLTSRTQPDDAIRALEAGADDVVEKPFAPEEMLARVRGRIKRASEDGALQPLTKLPANGPIEAEIRNRLDAGLPWSVLYLDLDGFKAFNDAFGFATGDDVIRLLANTLVDTVRAHGEPDDFVGHVGGDDFVAVMRPARAEAIGERVVAAFDRGIRAIQRDTRVPYCTVSVAVVSGSSGKTTYERVGERAAAVKKAAKRHPGSVVVSE